MSEESHSKKFSLFKKKTQKEAENNTTEGTSATVFDETCINFQLKGGPYQTSLIEACATMKVGLNIGLPLPLKCTWYRATNENQFTPIDGVYGAFYQPNADDIGCKICVHAVPVSEAEEYTGMPAFSEIGPIQIDPQVQSSVQEMLKINSGIFIANLIGGNSKEIVPGYVIIKVEDENMSIAYQNDKKIISVIMDKEFPQIQIHHRTNTNFSIVFRDRKLDFSTDKPFERDIIAISIRMFCNRIITQDQSDLLFKNQELSSRLFDLNKDYEAAISALNLLKENSEKSSNLNEKYQIHAKELEIENNELRDKLLKQNQKIEKYEGELKFLRQDIIMYKEQNETFELRLDQQKATENGYALLLKIVKDDLNDIIRRSHPCEKCKVIVASLIEVFGKLDGNADLCGGSSSNSSVRSFQDEISESTDENQDKEIRELREKIAVYKSRIKKHKQENIDILNKMEAEKNFFKRKIESLGAENEKLLSKLAKNPKDVADYEREIEELKQQNATISCELKRSQDIAANFDQLIKLNRKRLEEEIERNNELRKIFTKTHTMSTFDYQKIINSLTQSLADREEELKQIKHMNRELLNRISELEKALKQSISV